MHTLKYRLRFVAMTAAWITAASISGALAMQWMTRGVGQDATAKTLPPGPLGEMIQLGEALVEQTTTHPLTKPFIGNGLCCTNCHLQNGRHPRAGSFLDTATAYPAWSPREGRVLTLEDRILNCFMRSCHGTRPPLGSQVSVAIATYITWLSQDQPMRMNASRPIGPRAVSALSVDAKQADVDRGAALYLTRCADCHGSDGQGDKETPPVWGNRSYNDGAGLATSAHLGAWLKVAMPPDESDLTDQQAIDIAAFVNSHPRPHFALDQHLPHPDRLGEYNGDQPSTRE
jgi:thiosulfate dehydrogenase